MSTTEPSLAPPPPSSARTSVRWLSSAMIPALLVAVTLGVWWPVLRHGFVALDDQVVVFQNTRMLRLTVDSVCAYWTEPFIGLYAPLSYTLLSVVALFSVNPAGRWKDDESHFFPLPFHALDLALHCGCVVLVYLLLKALLERRWTAAAGALLFALHPVQVESVAWVAETSNLLCTLLCLGAICIFVTAAGVTARPRPRDARGLQLLYFLAGEVFLLALVAKPLAVVTPLLATIALWMGRRQNPRPRAPFSLSRPLTWPLAGLEAWYLAAIPFVIVARVAQPVSPQWVHVDWRFRPFVAADAIAFYVGKALYPSRLLCDYDHSPARLYASGTWRWIWIPVLLAIGALALLALRRRAPALVFGTAWFLGALSPVLGFAVFAYQHCSTTADRYLYLPLVGIALMGCALLNHLTRDGRRRLAATLATVLILSGLAMRTRLQLPYWRNTYTLYQTTRDAIGRDPGARQFAGMDPRPRLVVPRDE